MIEIQYIFVEWANKTRRSLNGSLEELLEKCCYLISTLNKSLCRPSLLINTYTWKCSSPYPSISWSKIREIFVTMLIMQVSGSTEKREMCMSKGNGKKKDYFIRFTYTESRLTLSVRFIKKLFHLSLKFSLKRFFSHCLVTEIRTDYILWNVLVYN